MHSANKQAFFCQTEWKSSTCTVRPSGACIERWRTWDATEISRKLGVTEVSQAPRAVRNIRWRFGTLRSHPTFHRSVLMRMMLDPSEAVVSVAQAESWFIFRSHEFPSAQVALFGGSLNLQRLPRRVPGGQGGVSSRRRPWC